MYYLIANEQVENTEKTIKHVYDISQFYGKVLDSMQALLENDKKNGIKNDYSIIETDGNEFRKEFFQTFSIKYEQEEEEEEDYEGSALEIIDTIGAGISPLKNLQDHLYFFIDDFLNEKDVDKKGGHYIASRLRAFLQTFDTLIDTVIDTLNDAIDLTEKRDGKV